LTVSSEFARFEISKLCYEFADQFAEGGYRTLLELPPADFESQNKAFPLLQASKLNKLRYWPGLILYSLMGIG
jgi:hypothetical protein